MVAGITKVRNEAHIIKDTIDSWASVCDEVFVYDDNSTDGTEDICRDHPAVVEVVSSNRTDPDRLRAEWYNRQVVLASAQRFYPEWIAYFDGDEHIHAFNPSMLKDPDVTAIAAQWHDMYVTPEDEHLPDEKYRERRWCSVEHRRIPYLFRNSPVLKFSKPDQRIMDHQRLEFYPDNGLVQHWGKGFSTWLWDRKVDYYSKEFGKYSQKWEARRGKAVHRDYKSDDGNPLQLWGDLLRQRQR